MDITDVTPVFEYWFKKKSGNANKQPAQIIASIVATGNKRFKNSNTKLDISRRNEAIEVYEEMEKIDDFKNICEEVKKIITASKNLQKAKLRKYKYVKEMLDLVGKIKNHIQEISNIFKNNATSTKEKQMYKQINENLDNLKISQIKLDKQKIGDQELPIKDNKDKFVIEVLAQLGYKKSLGDKDISELVKSKKAKKASKVAKKLHQNHNSSEKLVRVADNGNIVCFNNKTEEHLVKKDKFYSSWDKELRDIWRNFSNARYEKIFPGVQGDDKGALHDFLNGLGNYLNNNDKEQKPGDVLLYDAKKILNPKGDLKDLIFNDDELRKNLRDVISSHILKIKKVENNNCNTEEDVKNQKKSHDIIIKPIMSKIRRAWIKKYRDDED